MRELKAVIEPPLALKQEPTFLVCGEALIDVYPAAVSLGAPEARIGGSPLNVAIGLARMGQSVAFLGSISRDAYGAQLYAALRDESVDMRAVLRSEAPTTRSVVGLDARGMATYAFHGEGAADRELSLDALELIPTGVRAAHMGSYAMVVEPIASVLRVLVERSRESLVISWDPNVRLVVAESERWHTLAEWMLPRTDLLKLSDDDLSVLAPGAVAETFAHRALLGGVALVVVTHGSRGATAWSSSGAVRVPARHVRVVDTVGAGDAFQAALLTWLAENDRLTRGRIASLTNAEVEAALTFATGASAITCERRGANLPRREEAR